MLHICYIFEIAGPTLSMSTGHFLRSSLYTLNTTISIWLTLCRIRATRWWWALWRPWRSTRRRTRWERWWRWWRWGRGWRWRGTWCRPARGRRTGRSKSCPAGCTSWLRMAIPQLKLKNTLAGWVGKCRYSSLTSVPKLVFCLIEMRWRLEKGELLLLLLPLAEMGIGNTSSAWQVGIHFLDATSISWVIWRKKSCLKGCVLTV